MELKDYTTEELRAELKRRSAEENYTPDYWTRLEHQYAGMAMQRILCNEIHTKHIPLSIEAKDIIIAASRYIAHALVERYKKEEEL